MFSKLSNFLGVSNYFRNAPLPDEEEEAKPINHEESEDAQQSEAAPRTTVDSSPIASGFSMNIQIPTVDDVSTNQSHDVHQASTKEPTTRIVENESTIDANKDDEKSTTVENVLGSKPSAVEGANIIGAMLQSVDNTVLHCNLNPANEPTPSSNSYDKLQDDVRSSPAVSDSEESEMIQENDPSSSQASLTIDDAANSSTKVNLGTENPNKVVVGSAVKTPNDATLIAEQNLDFMSQSYASPHKASPLSFTRTSRIAPSVPTTLLSNNKEKTEPISTGCKRKLQVGHSKKMMSSTAPKATNLNTPISHARPDQYDCENASVDCGSDRNDDEEAWESKTESSVGSSIAEKDQTTTQVHDDFEFLPTTTKCTSTTPSDSLVNATQHHNSIVRGITNHPQRKRLQSSSTSTSIWKTSRKKHKYTLSPAERQRAMHMPGYNA
jgi:hypothetical protein